MEHAIILLFMDLRFLVTPRAGVLPLFAELYLGMINIQNSHRASMWFDLVCCMDRNKPRWYWFPLCSMTMRSPHVINFMTSSCITNSMHMCLQARQRGHSDSAPSNFPSAHKT